MLEPCRADLLEGGVVEVVVQTAGVVQQLPDGHATAVVSVAPDHARQPLLRRVVDTEPALRLRLQDKGPRKTPPLPLHVTPASTLVFPARLRRLRERGRCTGVPHHFTHQEDP